MRDGLSGVLLWNLHLDDSSYSALRTSLIALAWVRERAEERAANPARPGRTRTYYHARFSFERDVGTPTALSLCAAWLLEVFPSARAAAFVHRDTPHLHIHLWLDARDTEGRKLQLDWHAYRSLDESWNRLYAPIMGRFIEEHLQKKQETHLARQEGRDLPSRMHRFMGRGWHHRQELRNAGVIESSAAVRPGPHATIHSVRSYEPEQKEPHRDQPETPASPSGLARTQSKTPGRERSVKDGSLLNGASVDAAERALSEAHQLHSEIEGLARKERQNLPDRER